MTDQSQSEFPHFFKKTSNAELEAQGVNLSNFHFLFEEMNEDLKIQNQQPTDETFSAVFSAFIQHDLHLKTETVADMLSIPAVLLALRQDNDGLFSQPNSSAQNIALALIDSYDEGFQYATLRLIMEPGKARTQMIELGATIFESVLSGLTSGSLFTVFTSPSSEPKFIPGAIQLITMSQICHPEFSELMLQTIEQEVVGLNGTNSGQAKSPRMEFLESIHLISGKVDSLGCPAYERLPGAENNIPVVIKKLFLALMHEPQSLDVFEDTVWRLAMNASFSYLQAGVPAHKVIDFVRAIAHETVQHVQGSPGKRRFDAKDYTDVMIANAFSAHPEYWPAIKKEGLLGLDLDQTAVNHHPKPHGFGPFMLLNRHQSASAQFHERLFNAGIDPLSVSHAPRLSLHTAYLAEQYGLNPVAAVEKLDQMFQGDIVLKDVPNFLFRSPMLYLQMNDQARSKVVQKCVQNLNDPLLSHYQSQTFLNHVFAKEQSLLQALVDYVSLHLGSDNQLGGLIASIPEARLKRLKTSDRVMSSRLETDLGL